MHHNSFINFFSLFFIYVGLIIGRKLFGPKRKIIVNELTDELNYEYKSYSTNKNDNIKASNYKPIEGKNSTIIEMKTTIVE